MQVWPEGEELLSLLQYVNWSWNAFYQLDDCRHSQGQFKPEAFFKGFFLVVYLKSSYSYRIKSIRINAANLYGKRFIARLASVKEMTGADFYTSLRFFSM